MNFMLSLRRSLVKAVGAALGENPQHRPLASETRIATSTSGSYALALLLLCLAITTPAAAQTIASCPSVVAISQSASTRLVVGSATNRIYVCSLILTNSNAAAQTLQLVEGTGTTCATGQTVLGNFTLGAVGAGGPLPAISPWPWIQTQIAGDDLCLLGGAATISGTMTFRSQP